MDRPINLVVKEGEASDEVLREVGLAASDEVLGVVTEELEGGKHGKAAILEFLGLVFDFSLGVLRERLAKRVGAESEISRGIRALVQSLVFPANKLPVSDGGDDLEPALGRNGADGSDTVGDGVEGGAVEVDGAWQSVVLLDEVPKNSQLSDAAVL